ncbi:unnamed protein product [Choristocarpus tenellus]
MELMQALVKMNWSSSPPTPSEDPSSGTSPLPRSTALEQVRSPQRSVKETVKLERSPPFGRIHRSNSIAGSGVIQGNRSGVVGERPRASSGIGFGLGIVGQRSKSERRLKGGDQRFGSGEIGRGRDKGGSDGDGGVGAGSIFHVPYIEQLSKGLGGGTRDTYEDGIEAKTLREIGVVLSRELKKLSLKWLMPPHWVEDRVDAIKVHKARA